ncbi:MAG: valine--tRNA ligase [SAR324 cluster bacterium]
MKLNRYVPAELEGKWYTHWLDNDLFAPAGDPRRPGAFCIVIPPPNVTGSLHMGHAWDNALQDILIRWKRMQGFKTLWIPGTDHAGIATQWMVEKTLRDENMTKEQLGRDAFLKRVWEFKEEAHGTITRQLKRLGVSCDWSRERFTLDDGLSRAVRLVFVSLYREGLIYRDLRMVNWSPGILSAISDLEVDHKTIAGTLWHFRYPLTSGSGHVTVATTRPETMLGDTAVAVHPDDPRYTALVGQSVRLPLAGREIPIVADAYVDPQFGSGAVKITPGHDPNDFEIGKRHGLPILTILNEDGSLNDLVPAPYRGLDRFEARKRVVADLDKLGLLEKTEPHQLNVGVCSRSGVIVEPRVSRQWFVRIKPLAEPATEAVREKRIRLVPEFQEKVFFEWMNNIQDWCISRQLWWGHRIPVWYCANHVEHEAIVSETDITACPKCGSSNLRMETDVLDTWFSSGLWPLSTMGWPDETEDLKTFYPTSVLVTGYDILFFWVARMAMFGLKFRDYFLAEKLPVQQRVPFGEVLLHGLLRDRFGEKMSKTKGNGIDPLEMIDKYGADALRFTLAANTTLGQDMVLAESTIEGYGNFINKIWNATKFHLIYVEKLGKPKALGAVKPRRFENWILVALGEVTRLVNEALDKRQFNEACKQLYQFAWREVCDWYIELSKPALMGAEGEGAQEAAHATLHLVLTEILKLASPFMPFVAEELWAAIKPNAGFLMMQEYPRSDAEQVSRLKQKFVDFIDAEWTIRIIETIRTVRTENGVKPKQRLGLILKPLPEHNEQNQYLQILQDIENQNAIRNLGGIGELKIDTNHIKMGGEAYGVSEIAEIFLDLSGAIDLGQERERLSREIGKLKPQVDKLRAKLANPSFVDKAPAAVVEKNRGELAGLQAQLDKLSQSLTQLGA